MAGYRPYPEYKDSGVEWLGDVPNGWTCKRLKFLVSSPLKYGANEAAELTDADFPRYIRITDVNEDGTLKEETFRSLPPEIAKDYLLEDGDILLARSGATVGKTFIYKPSWGVAAYAGYLIRARMSAEMNPGFSYYFLQSNVYWQWLNSIFIQATIQNVSAEKYASLCFPVPCKEEQQTIVRFLDHKTTQIDALIAKKEELLEKLAEKRTALISHAVTKGLDSNVKMKDSGVEWLGEVPEHWRCVPFKWCCRIVEGQVNPVELDYSSQPLIAPNHIQSGTGKLLFVETAEEQGAISGKYAYKAGAVLYSKIRPALIKACIPDQEGLCSADMYPIYPGQNLLSEFLLFQILSKGFTQFALLVSDRVAMPKVNRESLGAFRIPMPPLNEQKDIIEYLKSGISELDEQANKARETVVRLKEYRSALITQAVTGKIDVRHLYLCSENQNSGER
jgi:type I restriction enzyme S subunit